MSDLIDRQMALDAFGLSEKTRKYGGDHSGYDTMMLYEIQDILEGLPSAEPEIIRCKDCMYYSRPRVDYCAWCSECRMAVNEDEYCSRAERRTDE